jgi:hypothetical protein
MTTQAFFKDMIRFRSRSRHKWNLLFKLSSFFKKIIKFQSKSQPDKNVLSDFQSKKFVSFSDNLDEQGVKDTCAHTNDQEKIEQKQDHVSNDCVDLGAVSIGKWFRSLSYDNNFSRDEERENEKQQPQLVNNLQTTAVVVNNKPNESTPKLTLTKSPNTSTTSKYQSFLSVNHHRNDEEAAVVAGNKTTKSKRSRRSNSLDSLKRTKKADIKANTNENLNLNKVTSSVKITRLKKSQSEKEECEESRTFSLENIKQLFTNAKNKTLNLSSNVGANVNTSFKEKVLNNSIVNNLKSLKSKSPKNDDDDELHQTLIDNQENKNDCKNNESGEQILPQTKE